MALPRDEHKLSEHFGAFIYSLREARGLSQRAAARLVGVSQPRLVSLEQGRHASTGRPTLPSPDLCVKLAAAYNHPKELVLLVAGYTPWVVNPTEAERLLVEAAAILERGI